MVISAELYQHFPKPEVFEKWSCTLTYQHNMCSSNV